MLREDFQNYANYKKAKKISETHKRLTFFISQGEVYYRKPESYITKKIVDARIYMMAFQPRAFETLRDYLAIKKFENSKKTA